MEFSYVHANPRSGHESYVLKFDDDRSGPTACLLVDSGARVDLEALLGEEEYLAAVVLTHAHLDHYRTIGAAVRDGAPVYASPATARVLETVLAENADAHGLPDPTPALDALEPIDGWEQVVPNVDVRPVPAGHAPGGVGFVVRFSDGRERYHVLVSGDLSIHRTAGYPGFTTELPCSVDALFLNVATGDDYPSQLTASIATIVERAVAGSTVLVTTGGLTGVEYAYLLAAVAKRYSGIDSIALAGQVAKLYADLEYDLAGVESITVFDEPATVFEAANVVIAGPEVPSAGSARRLFGAIEDDAGATLVQITSGGTDPVDRAGCTVYDYTVVDHPTHAQLEAIVDDLAPIELVIEHQRPGQRSFRTNENSFVWEHSDRIEYTLYDGEWRRPPWMTEEGVRRVAASNPRATSALGGTAEYDDAFPSVRRRSTPDLEAEGLETAVLERRIPDGPSSRSPGEREDPDRRVRTDGATGEGSADGDAIPAGASEDPPPDGRLEAIVDRLDAIERQLAGRTVTARVVDAGDGVTLLRPEESLAEDFEHGETVALTLAVEPDDAAELEEETD